MLCGRLKPVFFVALIGCGAPGAGFLDARGSGVDDSSYDDADVGGDVAIACASAGSLDPSFGVGGVTAPVFGLVAGQAADAVAVKIDFMSRIVIAGGFVAGPRSCVLARFLANGTRDQSFGANGIVRHSVGQSVCWFNDIAMQADAKLVAVGAIDGHTNPRALLSRFLADGTPDSTFGAGGDVVIEPMQISSAMAVVIDANQRILVVGEVADSDGGHFLTRRYLPNGAVDLTFGTNGTAQAAFSNGQDTASDVAILPDGNIIVVGGAASTAGPSRFGIVRYDPTGTRDATFASQGLLEVPFSVHANAAGVDVDSQGRTIVSGWSEEGGAMLRLTSTGTPDAAFGVSGKVVDAGQPGLGYASIVATGEDGLIAVGSSTTTSVSHLAIARYLASGVHDPGFGSNGFGAQLPMSSMSQIGWDVATQPDQGIVVVGGYGNTSSFDVLVARYCP